MGGVGLEGVTPISRYGSLWEVTREGGGGEGESCFEGGGARIGIASFVVGGAACLEGVVFRTVRIPIEHHSTLVNI